MAAQYFLFFRANAVEVTPTIYPICHAVDALLSS
jgi:hypothetical protein